MEAFVLGECKEIMAGAVIIETESQLLIINDFMVWIPQCQMLPFGGQSSIRVMYFPLAEG